MADPAKPTKSLSIIKGSDPTDGRNKPTYVAAYQKVRDFDGEIGEEDKKKTVPENSRITDGKKNQIQRSQKDLEKLTLEFVTCKSSLVKNLMRGFVKGTIKIPYFDKEEYIAACEMYGTKRCLFFTPETACSVLLDQCVLPMAGIEFKAVSAESKGRRKAFEESFNSGGKPKPSGTAKTESGSTNLKDKALQDLASYVLKWCEQVKTDGDKKLRLEHKIVNLPTEGSEMSDKLSKMVKAARDAGSELVTFGGTTEFRDAMYEDIEEKFKSTDELLLSGSTKSTEYAFDPARERKLKQIFEAEKWEILDVYDNIHNVIEFSKRYFWSYFGRLFESATASSNYGDDGFAAYAHIESQILGGAMELGFKHWMLHELVSKTKVKGWPIMQAMKLLKVRLEAAYSPHKEPLHCALIACLAARIHDAYREVVKEVLCAYQLYEQTGVATEVDIKTEKLDLADVDAPSKLVLYLSRIENTIPEGEIMKQIPQKVEDTFTGVEKTSMINIAGVSKAASLLNIPDGVTQSDLDWLAQRKQMACHEAKKGRQCRKTGCPYAHDGPVLQQALDNDRQRKLSRNFSMMSENEDGDEVEDEKQQKSDDNQEKAITMVNMATSRNMNLTTDHMTKVVLAAMGEFFRAPPRESHAFFTRTGWDWNYPRTPLDRNGNETNSESSDEGYLP